MGWGVRPTDDQAIRLLSDGELDAYIAETKRRRDAMTKATLRNRYSEQLRNAQFIRQERVG
jgi:hypothetical protein